MDRLIKIGAIEPKKSMEIKASRIGLGFEKLDRNAFDPEKAYDKVADIGVKWARIQSGWQRTERNKGVYDFDWLDAIVDNFISRGIKPWMCLCYGNDLYSENAKTVYGAVGCPPIFSNEEKAAWAEYVKALVMHYKGKVAHYEVWNEPDGDWCWKHGVSGTELGQLTVDTAKAIREVDAECKIIGGALCLQGIGFLTDALETGMGDWIDAVSFHEYTYDELGVFNRVEALRGVIDRYNPKIKIIQGESGSQSRGDGAGALSGSAGTPKRQAKQLLRHSIADLMTEVEFTSYFSCIDMKEALHGVVGEALSYKDFGYFGVLGADFDDDGNATGEYAPKPSYYALQNIAAVFSGECEKCSVPVRFYSDFSRRIRKGEPEPSEIIKAGFRLDDGSLACVYWKPTDLLTVEFNGTISAEIVTDKDEIKIVDLYDGSIYKLPDTMVEPTGIKTKKLMNIPLLDYPLVILL